MARPRRIAELERESRALARDLGRHNAELRELVGRLATNGKATDRVADTKDRIRAAEQRSTRVREELIALEREIVDESEIARRGRKVIADGAQAAVPGWEGRRCGAAAAPGGRRSGLSQAAGDVDCVVTCG